MCSRQLLVVWLGPAGRSCLVRPARAALLLQRRPALPNPVGERVASKLVMPPREEGGAPARPPPYCSPCSAHAAASYVATPLGPGVSICATASLASSSSPRAPSINTLSIINSIYKYSKSITKILQLVWGSTVVIYIQYTLYISTLYIYNAEVYGSIDSLCK